MATQLFRVVNRQGMRIRIEPNGALVRDRALAFGDILEVKSESRTEKDNNVWYEHALNPGWWTASEQMRPAATFMEAYQLDYKPPQTGTTTGGTTTGGTTTGGTTTGGTTTGGTTTGGTTSGGTTPTPTTPATPTTEEAVFQIVTDVLYVRSAPSLTGARVPNVVLKFSEQYKFKTPTTADGFVWWERSDKPGWWAAAGSVSGGQLFMQKIEAVKQNPQPNNAEVKTVPWVTQIQSGYNLPNDCGHSCVLMVMRYYGMGWNNTVNDLYKLKYKNSNGTTNQLHLVSIANDMTGSKLKLNTFGDKQNPSNKLTEIRNSLAKDKLAILLVWYPSLGFNNKANGNFNHWIVVTGYSGDNFYINDPLWTTENQGAGKSISFDRLLLAATDTGYGVYGVIS
jgi:hypothetical protein